MSSITSKPRPLFRLYLSFAIAFTIAIISTILVTKIFFANYHQSVLDFFKSTWTSQFLIYVLVGFFAQMIDGALGMAYGVSSTTFLMSFGISPAVASASVHVAEVFTTATSGISHWRFGNVNKELFKKLAIPGALGAGVGAYVLTSIDGKVIKPYIAAYLIVMGVVIIAKAVKKMVQFTEPKRVSLLALFGGFADASGGGGWGPIVTSTLIGRGNNPKLTIGTVNAVEFFVASASSGIFALFIGVTTWNVILGLIIGGMLAAPLGAFITHKINIKWAMILVGTLIIILSLRTIVLAVS